VSVLWHTKLFPNNKYEKNHKSGQREFWGKKTEKNEKWDIWERHERRVWSKKIEHGCEIGNGKKKSGNYVIEETSKI
jgi:hypothetical protein